MALVSIWVVIILIYFLVDKWLVIIGLSPNQIILIFPRQKVRVALVSIWLVSVGLSPNPLIYPTWENKNDKG